MDLQNSARLCRLCLCSSNEFIDVLEENGEMGFIVAKTIEDLLQFKVVKLGNFPWLACSTCIDKLVDFRLFKSRCIDSNITFVKRFRRFGIGQFRPKTDTRLGEIVEIKEQPQVVVENELVNPLEGESIEFKEEPQDIEESEIVNPLEVERVEIKERPPDVVENELVNPLEGERMEIKEEAQDDEENESIKLLCKDDSNLPSRDITGCALVCPEETTPSERPMSEVSETFGVDSALCHNTLPLNTHISGPHMSTQDRNKMVAESEKKTFDPNGQSSYELESENSCIDEQYCCAYCNAVFMSEISLRDHIVEHQEGRLEHQSGEAPPPTAARSVEERMCHGTSSSSSPINLSMKASYGSKQLRAVRDLASIAANVRSKSFVCQKCSRGFTCEQRLRNHEASCVGSNQCSRCKKSFSRNKYLVLHMKASGPEKTYSCPKCLKSFHFKCELVAHKQVHNKVFMCKDCDCIFSRSYHLKEHILIHCKVKPLACRDCKKTFIGSHALRSHRLEIHSGR